jgi:hypothetical protein
MPEHPGVLELLAHAAFDAGDAAALQHTELLIRRTALSVPVVVLHLQALAKNGRCDDARQVARSVSATYSEGCRVSFEGKSITCSTLYEKTIRLQCPSG